MSPRPLLTALLCLSLAGCAPEEPVGAGSFPLEVHVSAAVAGQLGAFQVAVLKDGSKRNCAELQSTCLAGQVPADALLVLSDDQGHEGRALRFPVNLEGPGQELAVDVPVGRDYALVIEALSADTPPRFLGSSCNYLKEVNAGRNVPVIAAPLTLAAQACNPTLSP